MDELDNKMIDHIREAFENFDDPTADEGWLLLRKKFPEKEKERPMLWLWLGSVAAILLLALGIGIWYGQQKPENENLITHKPSPIKHHSGNLTEKIVRESGSVKPGIDMAQPTIVNKEPYSKQNLKPVIAKNKSIELNKSQLLNTTNRDKPITPTVIDKAIVNADDNIAQQSPSPATANDTAAVKKQPLVFKQTQKPSLLTNTTDEEYAKRTDEKSNDKKVKLSLYAATYFNYAKGSENQINVGAGFASDFKLSKNLKLSTGISIGQNTLNYVDHSPTQTIQDRALTFASNSSVAAAGYTTSTPVVKNYNALLVGLDIPLNIKYEFNPQKSHSYMSVGISSGTFLNQTYTYNYNLPGLAVSQQPKTETAGSFSDFYFAKTLNVSFGIGYPLGKNHLIIEPFLKYPLAGLGSQQIYFGAGGLNLKFDFQSAKK